MPSPFTSRTRTLYVLTVVGLLMLFTGELWLSIRQLSQTPDEGAHLYSGYQYWRARDFGLNPEHPPLLKYVAAAPLLLLQLNQPHPPPVPSKFEEYIGGGQLLATNDAGRLLLLARTAASIFSIILALLVFAAAYEMFGPRAALIALFLCVLEPTLLAHGALVTTDMAATCTIFAAIYSFYRYIKRPTPTRLVVVGLAVGLALSSKFSALAVGPILILLLLAELLLRPSTPPASPAPHAGTRTPLTRTRFNQGTHLAAALVAVFAISFVVLWAAYTFRYQARPGNAQLIPTLSAYTLQLSHPGQARAILLLAHTHLLPESFLYGLVDVEVFGKLLHSFLLGKVYTSANKFYFPIAFLIKCTLPVLLLVCALPFVLLGKYATYRRELIFLITPPIIFLLFLINAPQNIGVRHLLPAFPFILLLAALAASILLTRSRGGALAVLVLLLWHAVSSLHAFPDYIPYANEAFGGPSRTYRLLTDSNADWDQSLKETRVYLERNKIEDCWFAHFGINDPGYYGIHCRPLPSGFSKMIGGPTQIIPRTIQGTILISSLESSGTYWGPGSLNPYQRFQEGHPDAMIGNSILVYRGAFDLPLASAESHAAQVPTLLRQHKLAEALSEAQTAATLAPDSPDIQLTLGSVLLKMGKNTEADQAFENAIAQAHRQDPGDYLSIAQSIAALRH